MINTIKDLGDIVRIVLRLCEFEGIDLEVDENGPVIRFREPDVKRVLANRLDYERMFRQAGKTDKESLKLAKEMMRGQLIDLESIIAEKKPAARAEDEEKHEIG